MTGFSAADVINAIRDEAKFVQVDLDTAYANRSGWWHRPFTEEELGLHPDGERIRATIDAAVRGAVEEICAAAASAFLEDQGADP